MASLVTWGRAVRAENQEAVSIDGSYGEGGGQIIRTSLSLAAMTGRPLEIANIRAKRSKPGLQAQHLTAVRAAAALCAAQLTGDQVGSTKLRFEPQAKVQPGTYHFDIRTAGASTLVAQTVLLPLSLAAEPSRVTIIGGTHVPHAPAADYFEAVYLPLLRRAGLDIEFHYPAAGFFPRGGGRLEIGIGAAPFLAPVDLTERGRLERLHAYVVTSGLPDHVGERGEAAVEKYLKGVGRKAEIERRALPSPGQGAAVVLVAECESGRAAFSALGERGKPMEDVATAPCKEFMEWWKTGNATDEHLADQLVLPMCFAAGESRWNTSTVTDHLRTVIWVARQFLPIEAELVERQDGSGMVTLSVKKQFDDFRRKT